jgi:hypothetical protein
MSDTLAFLLPILTLDFLSSGKVTLKGSAVARALLEANSRSPFKKGQVQLPGVSLLESFSLSQT